MAPIVVNLLYTGLFKSIVNNILTGEPTHSTSKVPRINYYCLKSENYVSTNQELFEKHF